MQRKQEIIDCALRLFSEKGFISTTVDDIAKVAGLAKASFYKIFESKDSLLNEVLVQFLESIEEMNRYVQSLPLATTKEKMEKHCTLVLEHLHHQRHFLLSLLPSHDTNFDILIKTNPNLAQFEKKIMVSTKEMLLGVFGDEIKPYIWDIVLVFHSLFKDYASYVVKSDQSIIPAVARLIADLLEMAISYFRANKHTAPVITARLEKIMEAVEIPPVNKENQIMEILKMMDEKVNDLPTDAHAKQEIREAISLLKAERRLEHPRSVMIKSLLVYISQQKELTELCLRLEYLLNQGGNL